MSKSKMLGLPKKDKEYPIIEIMGPMDVGKTYIAKLVARRINGMHVSFPVLDTSTMTGRALLSALSRSPRGLESSPEWWAHIYIANVYEQMNKLKEINSKMPLVITNYVLSYRIWMKATGVDMAHFLKGFTINLPQPNVAYSIIGENPVPQDRPTFDFSPEFVLRVQRGMSNPVDKRVNRVILSNTESKFVHVSVNSAACSITQDLKNRYKLRINETALYTRDEFLKKGDL